MNDYFDASIKRSPGKQQLVRDWIRELRAGAYDQGNGALRTVADTGDQFCCLGVACDILDPEGWSDILRVGMDPACKAHRLGRKQLPTAATDHGDKTYYLGHKARRQMGLTVWGVEALAEKNDEYIDFEEIANELELALQKAVAA